MRKVEVPPIRGKSKREATSLAIPEGSIAWAQGMFWKYIPPPWDQQKPITVEQPPIGAQFTESNKPMDTIQMIGKPGAQVPENITIDLGVADIVVSDRGRSIKYFGRGLDTDVGETVDSNTIGMTVGRNRPEILESYGKKPQRQGKNRFTFPKTHTRGRKHEKDTTLVRGVRM